MSRYAATVAAFSSAVQASRLAIVPRILIASRPKTPVVPLPPGDGTTKHVRVGSALLLIALTAATGGQLLRYLVGSDRAVRALSLIHI